jgi:hypothetical protein
MDLFPAEGFFEFNGLAMEDEKDKNRVQKSIF